MILESLITDESILTLDCAKARIGKGQKVEIPDKFWHESEVQGAIRLGLVKIVGDSPEVPMPSPDSPELSQESKRRLISKAGNRMAFECETKFKDYHTGDPVKWKDYVDPNNALFVPESAMNDPQIQNALAWGLLVDPDAKKVDREPGSNVPVDLQEATLSNDANLRRPARAAGNSSRAKPIRSVGESSLDDEDDMFRPSTVIDTQNRPRPSRRAMPEPIANEQILDLSSAPEAQEPAPKAPDAEPAVPPPVDDDFESSFEDLFGFAPDEE